MSDAKAIWRSQVEGQGDESRTQALSAMVRGEPIFYWLPVMDQLKRSGDLEGAFQLAWECMEVAERTLRFDGTPAVGWTRRLAVICRKMRRFDTEVQVIERWFAQSDPSRWREGVFDDMRHRLVVAKELLARERALEGPKRPEPMF